MTIDLAHTASYSTNIRSVSTIEIILHFPNDVTNHTHIHAIQHCNLIQESHNYHRVCVCVC